MLKIVKFHEKGATKRPLQNEQQQAIVMAEEPVEQVPIYHVYRHKYKRSRLKALLDAKGFSNRNIQIENERCAADLMYAMFKRPKTVLPTLLPGLIEIIKKKNSPDLWQSRMFRESIRFLLENEHASDRIKIFNVLLIICNDPETAEIFKTGYIVDHRGNLFGKNCIAHLDTFLVHLKALMYNTLSFKFGETTVVGIVHQCVAYAEQIYLQK